MQQHLGLRHLFERRAEAGHQRVRQIADEANRVGQQNLAAAGQLNCAQFRIERGEHAWRLQNLSAGQLVEERTLACVGVADQRHRGHRNRLAPLALLLAHAAHRVQLNLQPVNAPVDLPPIRFEFGFARSACADTAAQLRHRLALAAQPRQHVLQLRQLHLQLPFAGACMAGEDVQNQLRSVQYAARQCGFQVAQLCRRQVVIKEHQVGLNRRGDAGNLLHLAGANQPSRIRPRAPLEQLGSHHSAGACHQFAKFSKRFLCVQLR